MSISFNFKEENSAFFGRIYRPVAEVFFKHNKLNIWQSVEMLVDTGADYTLLPRFLAEQLGISLTRDCRSFETSGVGGKSKVFLFKKKVIIKLGGLERKIPLGFLANDYIPPLLGRQGFFETFKVTFEKFILTFE